MICPSSSKPFKDVSGSGRASDGQGHEQDQDG